MSRRRYVVGRHETKMTGREHEADVLGTVRVSSQAYKDELAKVGKPSEQKDIPYVPYEKAFGLAEHHQPWDPTNPQNEFLRELRLELYDQLGQEENVRPDAVRMYTAVNTPLDRYFGIDGFVTYEAPDGSKYYATVDASLEPVKQKGGYKADHVIGDIPSIYQEKDFLESVEGHARQVGAILQRRQEQGREGIRGIERPRYSACLDPSKIKVVCQRCGLRKEISRQEACRLGSAAEYEPLVTRGSVLIHSACNECASEGEEIKITFMTLRSAVN